MSTRTKALCDIVLSISACTMRAARLMEHIPFDINQAANIQSDIKRVEDILANMANTIMIEDFEEARNDCCRQRRISETRKSA